MTTLSLRLGARLAGLAGGVLRRFPDCVAVAVLATLLALAAANEAIPVGWRDIALSAGFWCAATGPFLAGLRLLAQGKGWPPALQGTAALAGALLLAAWAWAGHGLSAGHWFAGFHFLLPAAALLWALLLAPGLAASPGPARPGDSAATGPESRFWHGARRALNAFAAAALTILVLAAGLSAALLGLQLLLDLPLPDSVHADLWILAGLLLLPCAWLALLPLPAQPLPPAVPPALSIAIDLVLVPLALIYMAILYAYLGLAVLRWTLPVGTTAGLVAAYAAAGTAIWLIAAAPEHRGGRHVRLFRRLFFPALLPPLAMLAVALGIRIAAYGVTEPRYLLGLLALWMFGAALAQLQPRGRFRQHRITAVPALLCLLLILASVGPWGAGAVSRASQMDRLQAELAAAGLLRNGTVAAAEAAPAFEIRQRISAILDYLAATGRLDGLRPWLPDGALLAADDTAEAAAEALGITYVEPYRAADAPRQVALWTRELPPMPIAGYDSLMHFNLAAGETGQPGEDAMLLGGRRHRLTVIAEPPALALSDSDGRTVRFALDEVMDRLARSGDGAQAPHLAEGEDRGLRARLVLREMRGSIAAEGPVLHQAGGLLLVSPAPAD